MQPSKQLQYQPDPNKFDLRTHIWDSQGNLVSKNLYRAFHMQGSTYYERPVNSGNLWFENNQPAGRMEYTLSPDGKIGPKRFVPDAPHIDYVEPLKGAEKLQADLGAAKKENVQLRDELEAIRKDQAALKALIVSMQDGMPTKDLKPEMVHKVEAPTSTASPPTLNKRGG